jgi:hypothetical protein
MARSTPQFQMGEGRVISSGFLEPIPLLRVSTGRRSLSQHGVEMTPLSGRGEPMIRTHVLYENSGRHMRILAGSNHSALSPSNVDKRRFVWQNSYFR